MFYNIEGKVTEIEQNLVVISCSGLGFAINVTSNTLSDVEMNSIAKLYIYESIGENNYDLYGFSTKAEKRCFEMLTSVSGIGPKAALSILSYNTTDGLALAVMNGNEKALTAAPGIGKKIAQRVLLELKDKMDLSSFVTNTSPVNKGGNVSNKTDNHNLNDAVSALTVLGYNGNEVAAQLRNVDTSAMTTEEIIKFVLKQMSSKG